MPGNEYGQDDNDGLFAPSHYCIQVTIKLLLINSIFLFNFQGWMILNLNNFSINIYCAGGQSMIQILV